MTSKQPPSLMTIGEFSRLSRLSIRMLRHYDAHHLLTPAEVDEFTGHRRYASSQLANAALIRRLRDVGFGVAGIAAMLAALGTSAYTEALELQRVALRTELEETRQRLGLIDHMITEQESTMSITIARTTLPARTLVTLRGIVPTYADEGQLWEKFIPQLEAQGVEPIGPGGVIEHDEEYKESDVDESVWVEVAEGTTIEAPLEVHRMPAQDLVVATSVGPYSQISEAHERIGAYVDAEGLRPAASGRDDIATKSFNRYLNDPAATPPAELVTEVCVPLALT